MSYQVIARKYRPQRFADVVGQEHVTQTLANAIAQNRIAHAYLFCGPRGTGKTTVARIFAKCLNCTAGPKVDFDDADPRCQEITEGRSVDVLEIDGASNNGVEQVRELRETVKYMPASSKFKIFIIDEVHMLSTAAFNALLKTLEEPPEHVKFLFATTDPEKVLPTILSRCQRFDLRRIPTALIVKHLQHIATLEQVKIDAAARFAIARGADGGMRDAESALDQLISFCGNTIEEPDVLSMFGLTAQGQILEITRAILAGEAEPALRQLHDLAKHGKDLGRLLADLLNHFRNLLLFRVSRGDLGLLEVSEAEAAGLKEQSAATTTEALTRIMEVLTDTESRLRDAASKKILVEVALLNAIEARNAVSLDAVLKQLKQLREAAGSPGPAPVAAPVATAAVSSVAPAPAPATPPTARVAAAVPTPAPAPPAPAPAAAEPIAVPSAAPAATDLPSLWTALVEAVGRASAFTRSYLVEAHPVSFDGHVLVIGFDPEFDDKRSLLDNSRAHELLQTKLRELGHHRTQIKIIKADAPAGWAPVSAPSAPAEPPPAPAAPAASAPEKPTPPAAAPKPAAKAAVSAESKEAFKNDPLIKKALEVFKGRIVEVRA
jgi:DNA polymerase-3 subunit gamma/tau